MEVQVKLFLFPGYHLQYVCNVASSEVGVRTDQEIITHIYKAEWFISTPASHWIIM